MTSSDDRDALEAEIVRARDGDTDAFRRVFDARFTAVSAYVGAIARDPTLTEDIVAETFLQAWRDLPQLRSPGQFDHWLFRIAHNRALDGLRRRPTTPLEKIGDPADERRFVSPEEVLEASYMVHRLREALLALPELQRQVLVLRHLQGHSHVEIARQLARSPEAVRQLNQRAVRALRKTLEGMLSN